MMASPLVSTANPGGTITIGANGLTTTGNVIVNAGGGGEDVLGGDYVGVWSIEADGDVRPEWTIGKGILKQMRGLTLDPANRTVMVSDKYYNGVLTFALPEMFAAVADERARRGVPIRVQ